MRINVKAVTAKTPHAVTVSDSATVGELLSRYEEASGYVCTCIAHKGRSHADRAATLSSVGLADGAACIVVGRLPKKAAAAAQPSPPPASSPSPPSPSPTPPCAAPRAPTSVDELLCLPPAALLAWRLGVHGKILAAYVASVARGEDGSGAAAGPAGSASSVLANAAAVGVLSRVVRRTTDAVSQALRDGAAAEAAAKAKGGAPAPVMVNGDALNLVGSAQEAAVVPTPEAACAAACAAAAQEEASPSAVAAAEALLRLAVLLLRRRGLMLRLSSVNLAAQVSAGGLTSPPRLTLAIAGVAECRRLLLLPGGAGAFDGAAEEEEGGVALALMSVPHLVKGVAFPALAGLLFPRGGDDDDASAFYSVLRCRHACAAFSHAETAAASAAEGKAAAVALYAAFPASLLLRVLAGVASFSPEAGGAEEEAAAAAAAASFASAVLLRRTVSLREDASGRGAAVLRCCGARPRAAAEAAAAYFEGAVRDGRLGCGAEVSSAQLLGCDGAAWVRRLLCLEDDGKTPSVNVRECLARALLAIARSAGGGSGGDGRALLRPALLAAAEGVAAFASPAADGGGGGGASAAERNAWTETAALLSRSPDVAEATVERLLAAVAGAHRRLLAGAAAAGAEAAAGSAAWVSEAAALAPLVRCGGGWPAGRYLADAGCGAAAASQLSAAVDALAAAAAAAA
eukprot:Rhum_TRINITY_DN14346_c6_g1::Rhum_TRINITY_DN14346_c6_g1_i1::g.79899::m.79899